MIRVANACLPLLLLAASATFAQPSPSARSTLVRIEGGGAPSGLSILLHGLEKESSLTWRPVIATEQDKTLSALLARVNGWPSGAMTASTDALICERNPHICCPLADSSLRGRDKCLRELTKAAGEPSTNSYLRTAQSNCKAATDKFLFQPGSGKEICESVWRFIPAPANAASSPACDKGAMSPWTVCVPVVKVREQVGVQQVPFNPAIDKSIRAKYEELQGCSELSSLERLDCRLSFSEKKLNAFNYGDYLERARREGKITMPVRAYSIEIPAPLSGPKSVQPALLGASAARDAHNRPSLNLEWLQKGSAPAARTQQGPAAEKLKQGAGPLQALKTMGFDDKAYGVVRPAIILAVDQRPLFKSNPRLPEATINAFGIYEIAGPRKKGCPKGSKVAYKAKEWADGTQFDTPEHATEVVGILAAKAVPSSQVVGALSSIVGAGHVHALYIDDGRGEPGDQTAADAIFEIKPVAAFMNADCASSFPIVNVPLKFASDGRPEVQAEYEGVLFGRASEAQYALFVVAAGNPANGSAPRRKAGSDCHHLPGCKALNTQNMISVVGLDHTGEKASERSLHGFPFEVAAIGEVRTIDRTGNEKFAAGSSHATPFVASLASLIVGRAYSLKANGGMIQPADVKARILQTVDFLQDREIVEFGRVNFSRAMDIGRDILILSTTLPNAVSSRASYCAGSANCYVGEVDKADSFKLVGYDSAGSKIEVERMEFDRVLRLRRGSEDRWDVIYLPATRDSVIPRRLKNAQLVGITTIAFGSANARPQVPLASVVDYTRCMWRKGSDGVCLKGQ